MKARFNENALIKEVKSLLENFTSSTIELNDAIKTFNNLSFDYENLRSKMLNTGDTDILKSICYQHNVSNFSVFTGIFMVFDSRILKLNYAGSSSIAAKISKVISNSADMKYNSVNLIEFDSNNYYAIKFSHNGEDLVLVSQSSSTYFSRDKFKDLFNKLKLILPQENKSTDDLFTIHENIMKYIDLNCNEDYVLLCYIYSFPELMYIFGHMGDDFVYELDAKLIEIMENDFPGAKISRLSDRDYVIFERKEKNSNLKAEIPVPKIFFHCKNIPIPYTYHAQYVFEKNDFFDILSLCNTKIKSDLKTRC